MTGPAQIHLRRSIPLNNAGEVFKLVGEELGALVRRIPDGETGGRLSWMGWQNAVFEGDPNFDAIASDGDYRAATPISRRLPIFSFGARRNYISVLFTIPTAPREAAGALPPPTSFAVPTGLRRNAGLAGAKRIRWRP